MCVGTSYPLESSSLELAHKKLACQPELNIYATQAELLIVLETTCINHTHVFTAKLSTVTLNQPIASLK